MRVRRGVWACAGLAIMAAITVTRGAAAAPPSSLYADEPAQSAREDGPLGPVRIGGLVGGGVSTRPFDVEGMIRIARIVSLGIDYGVLPTLHVGPGAVRAPPRQARRLLLVPAELRSRARLEDREHVAPRHPARAQADHQVIDDVRRLRRDALVVLAGDRARTRRPPRAPSRRSSRAP